jgi:hypothetical protein
MKTPHNLSITNKNGKIIEFENNLKKKCVGSLSSSKLSKYLSKRLKNEQKKTFWKIYQNTKKKRNSIQKLF